MDIIFFDDVGSEGAAVEERETNGCRGICSVPKGPKRRAEKRVCIRMKYHRNGYPESDHDIREALSTINPFLFLPPIYQPITFNDDALCTSWMRKSWKRINYFYIDLSAIYFNDTPSNFTKVCSRKVHWVYVFTLREERFGANKTTCRKQKQLHRHHPEYLWLREWSLELSRDSLLIRQSLLKHR